MAGLVGITVAFADDQLPYSMLSFPLGRTYGHVVSCLKADGDEYLFDGSGEVDERAILAWVDVTCRVANLGAVQAESEKEGLPPPLGICVVRGNLSERAVAAVLQGTDHTRKWDEFYAALCASVLIE